jgi:hypothetical protein
MFQLRRNRRSCGRLRQPKKDHFLGGSKDRTRCESGRVCQGSKRRPEAQAEQAQVDRESLTLANPGSRLGHKPAAQTGGANVIIHEMGSRRTGLPPFSLTRRSSFPC